MAKKDHFLHFEGLCRKIPRGMADDEIINLSSDEDNKVPSLMDRLLAKRRLELGNAKRYDDSDEESLPELGFALGGSSKGNSKFTDTVEI